ncbi:MULTISPECIES: hypothetical protein [Leptospira]|uniref:Uncharacterized protein n=2 Tax=Leptospira interrogans TaxID=173 RepID=A0AAP9WBJ7_LEPIR|nr:MULTISPECIES: hypothetical protein [Leptospira]EMN30452.1 hypothetical protein LEP1GSC083_2587 [Leptospira interrogans serovar Pyrogenes str. L0374]KAA1289393.1 hypothetical protein C4X99_19895 [Leptospira interrogans serovar Geyaweera]QOI36527.1 hypothetical protein LeptoLang_20225 [Leptospira interrogans serovar Icterohaemorrhagiae]QOI42915.1 hypothetical protein Lepto782_12015 [Leptospira interrogans serovar Canicola]QOI43490.1 hypothetical protein Lepto782_15315 [Leptospira interrogans 
MISRKTGSKLPLKIELFSKPGKTSCSIARKNNLSRSLISDCIRGHKTSSRVNEILLTEWEISLADAREAYKEHKEKEILGNPVTFEEAFEWMVRKRFEYRTTYKGLVATWEEFRKSQYDLVYPIYKSAFAPRFAA